MRSFNYPGMTEVLQVFHGVIAIPIEDLEQAQDDAELQGVLDMAMERLKQDMLASWLDQRDKLTEIFVPEGGA